METGLEVLSKYRPFNRRGARDPGTGDANGKVQRRLASTQFQVFQLQLHVQAHSTITIKGIAVLVPRNCTRWRRCRWFWDGTQRFLHSLVSHIGREGKSNDKLKKKQRETDRPAGTVSPRMLLLQY